MKKAFTLIELLIVVAIIAILAAIAVPNFLEAQTRAKVSRVKADMRSYATAIEAYFVDNNRPPREWNTGSLYAPYSDPLLEGQSASGIMSNLVSTPIAYITVARLKDIFQDKNTIAAIDEQFYTYQDIQKRSVITPTAFWTTAIDFYGAWRMISVGPDRLFGHGFTNSAQLVYDPTNGTISLGNIHRSQKHGGDIQPPTPVLIVAH